MICIELFAGIGGFRRGLEQADKRYKFVWANELDKYACQIYRKNFGDIHEGDIRTVDPSAIPEHELLTAGFPCQSFSIAGKRRGFEDTRGTLFFEICRIARAKRTPYLLLENVKGLLSHDDGATFQTIIGTLDELGYDCQWEVLNSKNFGVPQNRERVFIVGHLRGERRPKVFPLGERGQEIGEPERGVSLPTLFSSQHKIARGMPMIAASRGRNPDNPTSRISGLPTEQMLEINEDDLCNTLSGVQKDNMVIQRTQFDVSGKGYSSQQDRVYHPEGLMACLPNAHPDNKLNIFDKQTIRRLTPTECERLQGFPDGWTEGVSDTQRYKQCGNAVSTVVPEAIGRQLIVGLT